MNMSINIQVASNGGFIVNVYDPATLGGDKSYVFKELMELQSFLYGKLSTSKNALSGLGSIAGQAYAQGATCSNTPSSGLASSHN